MQQCTKHMNAADSEDITCKKVAAYIRVSTQSEAQSESFRIQERYFKERIQGDSEAEFAGLYVDFGVSARVCRIGGGFTGCFVTAGRGGLTGCSASQSAALREIRQIFSALSGN